MPLPYVFSWYIPENSYFKVTQAYIWYKFPIAQLSQPRSNSRKGEEESKADPVASDSKNEGGDNKGFLSRFFSWNNNQAKLPDDKNPTVSVGLLGLTDFSRDYYLLNACLYSSNHSALYLCNQYDDILKCRFVRPSVCSFVYSASKYVSFLYKNEGGCVCQFFNYLSAGAVEG